MGNHEEVMLRVLGGETDLLASWLKFGGAETLRSYGLDQRELSRVPKSELVARLSEAVPPEHVAFLQSFADSISFGNYLFVHAAHPPGWTWRSSRTRTQVDPRAVPQRQQRPRIRRRARPHDPQRGRSDAQP